MSVLACFISYSVWLLFWAITGAQHYHKHAERLVDWIVYSRSSMEDVLIAALLHRQFCCLCSTDEVQRLAQLWLLEAVFINSLWSWEGDVMAMLRYPEKAVSAPKDQPLDRSAAAAIQTRRGQKNHCSQERKPQPVCCQGAKRR